MSMARIEERLRELEQAVERLQGQARPADPMRRWWAEDAGRFKDDPEFDEIVRLGRKYRESLRPSRGRVKRDRS